MKHFHEADIMQRDQRKILKKGAVPTIFPGLPKYLTKNRSKDRTDPSDRKKKYFEYVEKKQNELLEADKIPGYQNFL